MKAITVRDRGAGVGGMSLTDVPYPNAAENDVIVRVHAAAFASGRRTRGKTIIRVTQGG